LTAAWKFVACITVHRFFTTGYITKLSTCSKIIYYNPDWHYFRIIIDGLKIGIMKIVITIVVGTIALTPLILYILRRIQSSIMRRKIAAEGFETATDVLYPGKRRMFRQYKIGPVLPQ